MVSASPAMVPVPESEKSQKAPERVAFPVAVTVTVFPSSCPDAEPSIVTPPGHVAEKVPESELEVWLDTVH